MYCTNCGFRFEGNFCPRCGTTAVKITKKSEASSNRPEHNNIIDKKTNTIDSPQPIGTGTTKTKKNTMDALRQLA